MTDLKTHRRRYGILLLLICPLAAYVFMPRPPDFSVRKRAVKVTAAQGWAATELTGGVAYQWVDPHTLLAFHYHGTLELIDTRTGRESPLTGLMTAYARRPELRTLIGRVPGFVLSPDRRRLLTFTVDRKSLVWVVSTLDGTSTAEFTSPPVHVPEAFWDLDGRSFVQIDFDRGQVIGRRYYLGRSNTSSSIPLGADAEDIRLMLPFSHYASSYSPLVEIYPGHLLVANFGPPSGPAFLVYNLSHPQNPRPIEPNLPQGCVTEEVELSPDCRRVGWIFNFAAMNGDPALHHLPFVPVGPGHGMHEVWVSDLDGAGMHPVATPGPEANSAGPASLRWTPDGRNVTFLYSGSLYSAPANASNRLTSGAPDARYNKGR